MTRMPPLLLGLAFLLWGFCIARPVLGGLIAVLLEGLRLAAFRRRLSDAELRRSADLAALLSLAASVYFIVTIGMPGGLLRAVAWLPVTLSPLLLAASFGEADALRLRHVFLSLRNSRAPVAGQPLAVEPPYFVLLLLAAAAASRSGTPAASVFLPAASGLAALALFALRQRGRPLGLWAACTITALGLGAALSFGLGQLHSLLEEAVIDWLSGADTSVERSITRIGELGRVKQSGSIVWRLRSERAPEQPLLLFEAAYGRYAGQTWLAVGESFGDLPAAADGRLRLATPAPGEAARQRRLRLEGLPRGSAPLLPLPTATLTLGNTAGALFQRSVGGSLRVVAPPPYLALEIDYLAATAAVAPPPAPAYLSLPNAERALLQRLADSIVRPPATPQQRVDALRRFFADGFRYSLELGDGEAGRDLARFLEVSRAGHCEYYATATTLLLRALGVPARYAVGFAVQEYDPASRSWVLRRRHAHAWAQAWIAGRWVDVDTTPGEWVDAENAAAASPLQPLLDRLALAWLSFQAWRAGGDDAPLRWSGAALALLGLAFVGWRFWRRPRSAVVPPTLMTRGAATPLARVEDELTARFGAHCRRQTGETPRRWLARLRRDGCPGLAPALDALAELHDRLHFAGDADAPALHRQMDALADSWRAGLGPGLAKE